MTLDLVAWASRRGSYAVHVNDAGLRTADDKHVARFALRESLILVTNNIVDFEKIYIRSKLHPGLVFMKCDRAEIFNRVNQLTLFDAVLDDLCRNDLVQEALRIELIADHGNELEWEITRHVFPGI